MHVSSRTGTAFCLSLQEYEARLKACFSLEEGNEIWCAPEEGGYPCLSILVNGGQAVVNYFAGGNGVMAASLGEEGAEGAVEFCGGQYEAAAYQVVPAASAMECALAFFRSQKLPDCMNWEEL